MVTIEFTKIHHSLMSECSQKGVDDTTEMRSTTQTKGCRITSPTKEGLDVFHKMSIFLLDALAIPELDDYFVSTSGSAVYRVKRLYPYYP